MSYVGECETCGSVRDLWVNAVPGVPLSVGRCEECIRANAYPYLVLVANTYAIGSLKNASEWWRELVDDTLAYLGITIEQFEADVQAEIDAEREYFSRMLEDDEYGGRNDDAF